MLGFNVLFTEGYIKLKILYKKIWRSVSLMLLSMTIYLCLSHFLLIIPQIFIQPFKPNQRRSNYDVTKQQPLQWINVNWWKDLNVLNDCWDQSSVVELLSLEFEIIEIILTWPDSAICPDASRRVSNFIPRSLTWPEICLCWKLKFLRIKSR